MNIFTGYFAKLNKIPNDIVPISIVAKCPRFYEGIEYKKLSPKYDFFMKWKENHDNDFYIRCFYEQVLDKLNAEEVYKELEALSGGKDCVLICYEKPSDFCHRHIVANWLSKELGIIVLERSITNDGKY